MLTLLVFGYILNAGLTGLLYLKLFERDIDMDEQAYFMGAAFGLIWPGTFLLYLLFLFVYILARGIECLSQLTPKQRS